MAVKKTEDLENKLLPPDGGWGIVVALAVATVFGSIIVPTGVFGVVYGPFLATIGDETSGTAIVNSVFNTVLCFTGLPANQLLQRTSYRVVGLLGALLYFLGSFSCIFVTSRAQLVITWGILQGMGFGLMMPAVFTAFNRYFDTRRNAAMAMAQVLVAALNISFPFLATLSMDTFGFRGTVALISAYGLHCFPAMLSLQPVEWYMKKEPLDANSQMYQLSGNNLEENKEPVPTLCTSTRRDRKLLDAWKSVEKALDLGLFKQPSFVNIVLGLSLSMTSDLAFISIFPLLLTTAGFSTDELTLVMTTYFTADLISRIFVFLLTSRIDISSRKLFLFGASFSAIFRILYVVGDSFWWIVVISAVLGFLRSFIQIPLPLVVAEAFPTRFVTAFSLYMVVCGCVALSFGPLMSFVKQTTGRLDMVVHLLTLAHILCAVPWLIEMVYAKFVRK
ncbi:hypothetical protein PPYR_06637 [Photinus pyralis]|uniref:Major facilitator superfamily (MFS) profile domain-containing protein n=1 Tax=Photinus pyralis TaxID=7054 RepID=A0A5N4AN56_PHOPY|nr:monocarboxylate transporter 13-like [Photinus pyralis]XP_031341844.1 monocarboxylate transporter 13-like [Photinus pyralis]KAB0798757.1 hypothetical protein PPYR_06637 [Photinus pyralis]